MNDPEKFHVTHVFRHRKSDIACDQLMQVRGSDGFLYYTEKGWENGRPLRLEKLPEFDVEPVPSFEPFRATHRLRHRESGEACDVLMRVEAPAGERFYTKTGWEEGLVGLRQGDLPSFDIEAIHSEESS